MKGTEGERKGDGDMERWKEEKERERWRNRRRRERKTHTGRSTQKDKGRSPIVDLLHKRPQELGLGQTTDGSLELNLGFQCGWQEPKNLSHYLLPPKIRIRRSQD